MKTTMNVDKELIINAKPTEVEIALLEDGNLVEIHRQKTNNNFTVGDIFLGKIRKLMPGLNAAFVDIGHKKDAFLHYTDLGPKLRSVLKYTNGAITGGIPTHSLDNFNIESDIDKNGKIDQVLTKRDTLLVQILKEPISTKGPRLSCEINLPGRYMVLLPFSEGVNVSKKIPSNEERKRLQALAESIKPKNFGMVIRTAAEGKKVADLHEELMLLMDKWKKIHKEMHRAKPPVKLLSEMDKASTILRDVLNDSFNKIVVNDKEFYFNIKNYLEQIAPDQVKIVSLYTGARPIFDHYGITRQIKSSFGKTATMKSGAYLVIEHTEAMHVVDVNSGHKMGTKNNEDNVLNINKEAAEEIARQLRLRDIGGIITIDFIDMKSNEHRRELLKAMREAMSKDRAQHTILPLSKFGLMQLTRERVRPEVKIDTSERCPSCNGTGKINASIVVTDEIQRDLDFIFQNQPKAKLSLKTHPYIEAYFKKGWRSIRLEWFFKYGRWVKLIGDANYGLMEYRFFDANDEEIRLN
jgi:ribonuclease G